MKGDEESKKGRKVDEYWLGFWDNQSKDLCSSCGDCGSSSSSWERALKPIQNMAYSRPPNKQRRGILKGAWFCIQLVCQRDNNKVIKI